MDIEAALIDLYATRAKYYAYSSEFQWQRWLRED